MTDNPDLAARLAALKQTFVLSLPERATFISKALGRIKTSTEPGKADLSDIRDAAHKLVGTGATFGLISLSGAAREVEASLDPYLRDDAAQPATAEVEARVEAVLAAIKVELDQL